MVRRDDEKRVDADRRLRLAQQRRLRLAELSSKRDAAVAELRGLEVVVDRKRTELHAVQGQVADARARWVELDQQVEQLEKDIEE